MATIPGFIVRLSAARTWLLLLILLSSGVAPALGETIFVRADAIGANDGTSWENAFVDLQDALAVAQAGDEIWVAAGVYKPDRGTGDRKATFALVNGAGVYGGFTGLETGREQRDPAAHETILSGDLNGDDGSFDCGKESDCCADHLGRGCEDQACQERVCELIPRCCGDPLSDSRSVVFWECSQEAEVICCELTAGSCENSFHVVTVVDANASTTLDGFTIKGGRADGGPELDFDFIDGAGVLATGGNPVFSNCIFRENSSLLPGAGMVLEDSDAALTGCTFTGNLVFGGALCSHHSAPTLTDCVFSLNNGGGMESEPDFQAPGPRLTNCLFEENSSAPALTSLGAITLTECTFIRNSSRAFSLGFHGRATLSGCTFLENNIAVVADDGLIFATNCLFLGNHSGAISLFFSNGGFTNCVFSGNTGTAIDVDVSGLRATNCTVVGNVGVSAIFLQDSAARIENCILWGNMTVPFSGEYAQLVGDPDNIWINHTLVEGWTGKLGGVGNFDADPLFVDADGFDDIPGTRDDRLQLQAGSPAINAGDKLALTDDALDLDGDGDTDEPIPFDLTGLPRIQGKAVDLGAYEGGNQMIVTDTDELSVPEGGTASFAVSLLLEPEALEPGGATTVYAMIRQGDSDISVQRGQLLIFDSANYAIPQTVTIAAAPDTGFVNGTAAVRLSAFGITPARVSVREVDSDPVPPTVFVDQQAQGENTGMSWADAFTELTDALSAAEDRPGVAEIWVAAGRYTPDDGTGDREATFELVNGVGVYGGFAGGETRRDQRDWRSHRTILSGDLAGNDVGNPSGPEENSRHVVTAADVDPSTVLDGFTVSGGNGEGFSSVEGLSRGGGLLISSGSPSVANCNFSGNVGFDGGAVWISHLTSSVFRNCVFRNNLAREFAGAVAGDATLINCLVAGNTAALGPNGAVGGNAPVLVNCTVVQNVSLLSKAGAVNSRTELRNSIIWGNRSAEEDVETAQLGNHDRQINYSAVEGWSGWFGGVGNTGDPPLFVDPIGPDGIQGTGDEDFRLMADSPLINRGDPGYNPAFDETDLNGSPRIAGCRIDLGAFESDVFQASGDFDGDELRTLSDYAGFQNCFQAEATNPDWVEACLCVFDSDGNGSLDLTDFAAFHALLTGP